MSEEDANGRSRAGLWSRRLLWLVTIWAAGIAVLGLVAYLLRLIMNAAGLTV